MADPPVEFSGINVKQPVGTAFLADVFGLRMETVRQRLAGCPRKEVKGRGYLYDFAEACGYLAKPKLSIEDYLDTVRPEDLPAKFRKDFWQARKVQQEVQQSARELWHDDDVLEVLLGLFTTIRSAMRLWTDRVEREHGLSGEQRETLIEQCDALQDEIYDRLCESMKAKATPSSAERLRRETARPRVTAEDII